ncbi:MAG TPA: hypothetical protein PLE74_09190 [Candidatus Cloacimonadota bacterium]|nr:hypothetical protein [Candidatus Cloacimonadota bacterium]
MKIEDLWGDEKKHSGLDYHSCHPTPGRSEDQSGVWQFNQTIRNKSSHWSLDPRCEYSHEDRVYAVHHVFQNLPYNGANKDDSFFKSMSCLSLHDAVYNTAMIWSHIWQKASN